jgi:serine/threonine-protein kinase
MFDAPSPRHAVTTDSLRDQLQGALGSTFVLERELGGGGMSLVFVAEETAFRRRVVLKVLRPEIAEAVSIERFRRETQLAARLQHPHIVPLFGGGEAGGFLYYTMPLIEGESLRARLESEGQLSVSEALRLARESAEALAYAHARGVVHRDIKPENILLSDNHALITDFGIARALDAETATDRLTSLGIALGTPAYMSPEQAAGESDLDGRTDVYSLGCVLYEMLAGEPPFTGPTVQAIIARRFTDRAPSVRAARPSLPPAIDALTAKAMATMAADRFPSAAELASALGDAPLRAVPAPRRRRSLVTLATLAAGGLAVLGAAAWGVSHLASPPRARSSGTGARALSQPASIAVLTLTSSSPDTLNAYLADGLTEEITARLSRVGSLRMKSRGTVARVRATTGNDAIAAGRALGVDFIVGGDVRRAGDSVRVAVQVVTLADSSEVSDVFTMPVARLVTLRDSITTQIASRLRGRLTSDERATLATRPSQNPEAYDHYLRGNFHLAKRNPVSVARAIEEYEAAHRIDPQMTRALARQGYAYSVYADWGWAHPAGLTRRELLRRGLAATDSALSQDSTNAEAWLARAHLLFLKHPRTLEGVVPAFERAVSLDTTSAEAEYQYGQALMAAGLAAKARARYLRAIALEPDWASPRMSLGALVGRSHQFDLALALLDSAIAVDPSSSYSYAARSNTRVAAGNVSGALQDAESAVRMAAGYRVPPYSAMAIALAAKGDSAGAREWADSASRAVSNRNQPSATDAFYAAAALVRTGQVDRGLTILERADPENAWLWFYMTSPMFDPVRTHPRFVRVSNRARPPGA